MGQDWFRYVLKMASEPWRTISSAAYLRARDVRQSVMLRKQRGAYLGRDKPVELDFVRRDPLRKKGSQDAKGFQQNYHTRGIIVRPGSRHIVGILDVLVPVENVDGIHMCADYNGGFDCIRTAWFGSEDPEDDVSHRGVVVKVFEADRKAGLVWAIEFVAMVVQYLHDVSLQEGLEVSPAFRSAVPIGIDVLVREPAHILLHPVDIYTREDLILQDGRMPEVGIRDGFV